jgi:hypothetical protein
MKLRNKSQDPLILCGYQPGGFPLIIQPGEVAEVDTDRLKAMFDPKDLEGKLEPANTPKPAPVLQAKPPEGPDADTKEKNELIQLLKA